MAPLNVLITDSFSKHAIGIAKYITACGINVTLWGINPGVKPSIFRRHIHQAYYKVVVEGDLAHVLKTYDEELDFVIPVWAESVIYLADHGIEKAIIPSKEAIQLCLDKKATADYAETMDIPVPRTWLASGIEQLSGLDIRYPCVVKSASELSKVEVRYPADAETLKETIENNGRDCVIQDYISGVGIGFFALYIKGELKRFYMHQRLREYPITGGPSVAARTIYHEKVYHYGKKLLDSLKWHGVAMVEFKINPKSGDIYLMEINPKFWGSVELGLAAGINFGELLIEAYTGRDIKADLHLDSYKKIKFYWPLDNDWWAIFKSKEWKRYLDYFKNGYVTNVDARYILFKINRLLESIIG